MGKRTDLQKLNSELMIRCTSTNLVDEENLAKTFGC